MKLPDAPPFIDSLVKADAIGRALHDVMFFDPAWAMRVYIGDSQITYPTGPEVLNAELKSQWESFWGEDEKREILTAYTMKLIER